VRILRSCQTGPRSHDAAFGSTLTKRLENERDASLVNDLQSQIRGLPLLPSPTLTARQDELDRLGTELWNISTRLRRDDPASDGKTKADAPRKVLVACLLRVFAFFLLDSAAVQARNHPRKSCIRLMKVALKAARVCIERNEPNHATKILERAAEYQDVLGKDSDGTNDQEKELANRLRVEYFAVRTTLVGFAAGASWADVVRRPLTQRQAWRQDRMDMAEHMFSKCKQLITALTPTTAESLADLMFEIGKDNLTKRNYETAVRWLERAHDLLGEQDLELLSPEAGELRLSTMHNTGMACSDPPCTLLTRAQCRLT
jgi:hypothetical protein